MASIEDSTNQMQTETRVTTPPILNEEIAGSNKFYSKRPSTSPAKKQDQKR